jgi:threonine dehydrogenase-like Zn-dependent dehydrogenase
VHRGIALQSEGVLQLKPLISHVIPFSEIAQGYELLDRHPDEVMQIVLDFNQA